MICFLFIIIIHSLKIINKVDLFPYQLNLGKKNKSSEEELNSNKNKTIQLKKEREKNLTNINNNRTELKTGINSSKELEEIVYEEFNEDILNKYKEQQNEFCINENKSYNLEYEKKIKEVDVELLAKSFKMYVYNSQDIVSKSISSSKKWEGEETIKLLKALNFYSYQKNIAKENIYVLDIGSNVGWYTFYLAKYGYKILSFEPSNLNMYILSKNYCLNRELNVTLIKKGLYTEEKVCDFYISRGNIGDGWVFCDKNKTIPQHLIKSGETILTRLANYASFLSRNNLALIKIDVEGSEEKALISGVELITKYKVPFIFLEFTPSALEGHGTNSTEFLTLFEKNGYKFSNNYFLDSQYLSVDDIIKRYTIEVNLYIVHSSILNSNKE
jgi:FkbM family methyltransferase